MPASLVHPTRAEGNAERKGWPARAMPGSDADNSTGVAVPSTPKEQRLDEVVSIRTENARGTRKPTIVALARKLLIALWRLVRDGVVPDGVVLRRHNERRTLKTP